MTTVPRSRPRIALLATVTVAASALSAPAHASTIDWLANALDGLWSTRVEWEDSAPPSPDDVARFPAYGTGYICRVNVDPAVFGVQMLDASATLRVEPGRTLTILDDPADLNGFFALVAGTLDLASGTLVIDDSINGGGGIDNDGLIVAAQFAEIDAAMFDNSGGTLRIEGRPGLNSQLRLVEPFTNAGIMELDSTSNGFAQLTSDSATVTNAATGTIRFGNGGSQLARYWRTDLTSAGSVVVDPGAQTFFDQAGSTLHITGGDLSVGAGGRLTNSGVAVMFDFEDVTIQNDGTLDMSGAASTTRLGSVTLLGNPVQRRGGTLEFTDGADVDGRIDASGNLTLLGDIPPATHLFVSGMPGINTITAITDHENHGDLELTSISNGFGMLEGPGTLFNFDRLRTTAGGSQPTRYLRTNIDSTGELRVGSNTITLFDRANTVLRTDGDMIIEPDGSFSGPNQQTFILDGGSLVVDGTFSWSSGTVIWNAGTIDGTPLDLRSSSLTLAPGVAGPAEFHHWGNGTHTGDIPADVRVRVEGRPGINSIVLMSQDVHVDGALDLDSTSNGFPRLEDVPADPRTLSIGPDAVLTLSEGGSQPARYLQTNTTVDGSMVIEPGTAAYFDRANRTLTIHGTMDIGIGSTMRNNSAPGTFRLAGGTVTNDGIFAWSSAGARVELESGSISGVPLDIRDSTLAFPAGSDATAEVAVWGNGTIEGDIPATAAVSIEGRPGINATYAVEPGATLAGTIDIGSTSNGFGRLGGPSGGDAPATNLGTITVRPGGSQPARYLSLNLRNEGRLDLEPGTVTTIVGELVNAGLFIAGAPVSRNATGVDFVNDVDGTLAGIGPIGSITSTVLSSGTTSPGEDSTDILAFVGDWEQTIDGRLLIELGGDVPGFDHDQLTTGDDAILGGRLDVVLVDGYTPAIGETFTIIQAAGEVVGTFDFASCPSAYTITYGPDSVMVTINALVVEGDVNCDGIVGFADVLQVLAAYGVCDGCIEDIDGDGLVGFSDVLIVLANWS